jgi:hypothetical protein
MQTSFPADDRYLQHRQTMLELIGGATADAGLVALFTMPCPDGRQVVA